MKRLIRSLIHASQGIVFAMRNERNFQIEIVAAVLVLILMVLVPLSTVENAIILTIIALVLTLELLNTALEHHLDLIKPHVDPSVKIIKDLVAGSVLVASFFAALVGFVIFFPHFG